MPDYCNTLIAIGRPQMANMLSTDKQVTSAVEAVRAAIAQEYRNLGTAEEN